MSVCICIFFFWQKNKLKLVQITKITDFAIRFNFLQVCPSAIPFVFVALFIPS